MIARDAFASAYGALSVASRLRRVCSSPTCISPYHHVVQNPLRLAEIVDCSMEEVRAVANLIRSRQRRDPEEGICWDVDQPHQLGLREERMRAWASRLDEAPLLVLAAYASLVGASQRSFRRHASASSQPRPVIDRLLGEGGSPSPSKQRD